jgi:hypothetical protein
MPFRTDVKLLVDWVRPALPGRHALAAMHATLQTSAPFSQRLDHAPLTRNVQQAFDAQFPPDHLVPEHVRLLERPVCHAHCLEHVTAA